MIAYARNQSPRSGFTLLELLVSIAIIGILMALLLPAVQSAREAARMTQCRNNLKQLGIACHSFESSHRFFPSNGWGYLWVGDPDRGVGRQQPGGWVYQLLPFLEQGNLSALGRGQVGNAQKSALLELTKSYVAVFDCPSRPESNLSEQSSALQGQLRNADWTGFVAKSDYAINEGDYVTNSDGGPPTLAAGDDKSYPWVDTKRATGISFIRSQIRPADVTDGLSNTYLIGEKSVPKIAYNSAADGGHDQSMFAGADLDMNRWALLPPAGDDTPFAFRRNFGSAHVGACHMLLVDGSVRMISYSIDTETHRRIGNRRDGLTIGEF